MLILGIDPGYERVGFAVIESLNNGRHLKLLDLGTIKTSKTLTHPQRLQSISEDIQVLINRTNPQAGAVEELFFNTNQKTALLVAQARGVILLTLQQARLTISEYTPLEVKMALTGYGRADKEQVKHMVKATLKLKDMPKELDDAVDAVAVAICHAVSYKNLTIENRR